VCYTGWNWCVDGVLYWLELVCRRCVILIGTGVQTVCYTGWNWCVDGVLYWLELVCRRCVILFGTGV